MELHAKQRDTAQSNARFKTIRAGRRSGKTAFEIEQISFKGVRKSIEKAMEGRNRNIIYIAPTAKQARTIVWEALKARLAGIGKANEQRLEMRVPTVDGGFSTIFVGGWENRENYRGMSDVIHITFDELDTLKEFFISWLEIFRPMLMDTGGTADFIGTPKKENPNLRRLEKEGEGDPDWESFHFTTYDNPHIAKQEIDKARLEMDADTFKQEIMAEYVENVGSLFKYTALVDMFSNTVEKDNDKYLIIDVADDGSDTTVFNYFRGLESYKIEVFTDLNSNTVIDQIRESAADERIPYSHIAIDAIGVGAAAAKSSLLDGIVGYKSSYKAIKTDRDIVRLPNVHYTKEAPLVTEYANLRSQCVFALADLVNKHEIACSIDDIRIREKTIEELALYQDMSKGDGKRFATPKETIKELLGRSPDISDTFIMRMYFEIRGSMVTESDEDQVEMARKLASQFQRNMKRQSMNSTK